MLAELSAESQRLPPSFGLRPAQRLAMVCLGYIGFLHVLLSLAIAVAVSWSYGMVWAVVAGVASVYLLPPLAVSATKPRKRLAETRYPIRSIDFLRWWYTAQWQVVFNRFPQLEEALRLVPGLYSAWLRLWGGRIGRLVYWSPGLAIFDRPFLEIGDRVVLGAHSKLVPHLLARGADGATELLLAPIKIGDDAMIGGWSILPAGVHVAPCEQTPGARPMAPFSRFESGRHVRTIRFHKDQ